MLNELSYYEIDIDYLGDSSDDDGEGGGSKMNDDDFLDEKQRLLRLAQEGGEDKELNPLEQALSVLSEDYRKEDMLNAAN